MVCTTLDKESPIQAVCPNWARTDLCGGREVTRVPTAKVVADDENDAIDPERPSEELEVGLVRVSLLAHGSRRGLENQTGR